MRAYERLIRYAKVHTTSNDESETCPSTARQFDLAHMLVAELKELGVSDARVDEKCYVYGSIPATPGCEDCKALGLIAHMDTAPDASGENVKPMLHENYDGCDLTLPGGTVLSVEKFPFLRGMKGETLITSDGTTLLGADDKAGVAEIMTAVEELLRGDKPHGKVCVAFTPDEEIGRGADEFDIPGFGADFAYTVDGGDVGSIEYENFNAAGAAVVVKGFSVHPGSSKDTMINAANVAIEFHNALPAMDRPEHTDGYEGFFHLISMSGDCENAELVYIIRDHDKEKFADKKAQFESLAAIVNEKYGQGSCTVSVKDSYYNMKEIIDDHMYTVERAKEAMTEVGVTPIVVPIRGGTDGARLSFMGLPCPNICTGGENFHSRFEFLSVESLSKVVEIVERLIINTSKVER